MAVPCPICTEPNEPAEAGKQIVCSLCGTAYDAPPDDSAPAEPEPEAQPEPEPELIEDGIEALPDEDDALLDAQPTLEISQIVKGPNLTDDKDVDPDLANAATTMAKPPSKEELARIAAEIDAEEAAASDEADEPEPEPEPEVDEDLINAATTMAKPPSKEELARIAAEVDAQEDFASAHTAVAKVPSPEEIARLAAVSRGEELESTAETELPQDQDEEFISAPTVVAKAPTEEEIAAAVAAERAKAGDGDTNVEALPQEPTVDANPLVFEDTPSVAGTEHRDLTVVGKPEGPPAGSAEPGALGKGMRRLSVNLGWTAEEEEIADDPHHFYRIPSAVAVDYSFYSHSNQDMTDTMRTGISRDLNDTGLALRAGRIPEDLRKHIEHDLGDLGMSLEVDLGHRTIAAQGKPLWRKDLPRGRVLMGIEFVDLHPGDAEAIRQFAKSASMKPKVIAGILVGLGFLAILLAFSSWLGSSELEGAVDRLGESLERTTEQLGTANAQLEDTQKQYSEAAQELDAQTKALEELAREASALAAQFRENAALAGLETDEPDLQETGVPAQTELTARIEELQMLSEALREQLEAIKPKKKKAKRRKKK